MQEIDVNEDEHEHHNQIVLEIKGLDDRFVISIDIKVKGMKQYSLDAQVDTRAMNSSTKFKTIPSYYWKST